ncbi:MAG: outer membrane lipoprotein-sorting protein [Bdellovibrionales bacterium]|nr:outer membrane lipoprotein-sorting protein [Bdellovibrionales bacterium]
MLKFISVLLTFIFSLQSHAIYKDLAYQSSLQSTPEQIMNQVYYVNQFYSFSHVPFNYQPKGLFTLVKKSTYQVSTLQFERYINFEYPGLVKAKDLILFKNGKMDGTSLLITDYNDLERDSMVQVWMPELRKVRRVSQNHDNDLWMGSAFTHGDMKNRKPYHESHELLGTETYTNCAKGMSEVPCISQNKKVLVVKSIPIAEYNVNYDYRISYVDAESYADYRTEYFRNNQLVKEVEKNWLPVGLPMPRALIFSHWYVKDFNRGTESLLMMQPLKKETTPDMFTEAFLRKSHR